MSYGSNPDNQRPTKTRNVTDGWVKPTYLDIGLTDEQRSALAVFATEFEYVDLMAWMGEKCASGHSLELKGEDGHFYARATGIPGSEHAGLCLTARASSAEKAWHALAFRDIVILAGGWPKKTTRVLDL